MNDLGHVPSAERDPSIEECARVWVVEESSELPEDDDLDLDFVLSLK